jgi:hypothetical protein
VITAGSRARGQLGPTRETSREQDDERYTAAEGHTPASLVFAAPEPASTDPRLAR